MVVVEGVATPVPRGTSALAGGAEAEADAFARAGPGASRPGCGLGSVVGEWGAAGRLAEPAGAEVNAAAAETADEGATGVADFDGTAAVAVGDDGGVDGVLAAEVPAAGVRRAVAEALDGADDALAVVADVDVTGGAADVAGPATDAPVGGLGVAIGAALGGGGAAGVGGGVTHVTGGAAWVAAASASPFSVVVSASSSWVTEIKLLNPRPRRDFGFCIFATFETPFPIPPWNVPRGTGRTSEPDATPGGMRATLPKLCRSPQTSQGRHVQKMLNNGGARFN